MLSASPAAEAHSSSSIRESWLPARAKNSAGPPVRTVVRRLSG